MGWEKGDPGVHLAAQGSSVTSLGAFVHLAKCLLLFFLLGCLAKELKFSKTMPGQFKEK